MEGSAPGFGQLLPDEVRAACAWVAGQSRSVSIDQAALAAYAETLPPTPDLQPPDPRTELVSGDRESRAAFTICLDAINFGSGWWPTIRKRPGHSGYATIAAAVVERFREYGPWTCEELGGIERDRLAFDLEQNAEHPLMAEYARALRDVGAHVGGEYGGSFAAVADAGRSAAGLAELLAEWDAFADASSYENRRVPFFKRAQIAAADVARGGVAPYRDLHRLTAFADNLVPHTLRMAGVLRYDDGLAGRIAAGELLEVGEPAEVEIRACGVHAVELVAAAAGQSPAAVDQQLWQRGQSAEVKAQPRHRCRTTWY